jgi:hypothetical protein
MSAHHRREYGVMNLGIYRVQYSAHIFSNLTELSKKKAPEGA